MADRLLGPDSLAWRIAALVQSSKEDLAWIPEAMAAWYRREAERYLRWLPAQRAASDPVGEPRLEIYLDVSGSMPDPRFGRNVLTLAAHVLVMAAVRAGGAARLILYSGAPLYYEEWCRSEQELSGFLMHYLGGPTRFPFDLLEQSVHECHGQQPLRVVLSDADFDLEYDRRPEHAAVLAAAVAASPSFVLFLHLSDAAHAVRYRQAGARAFVLTDSEDYPRLAAELARALVGEEAHVAL
jgi:hypothetical protein